MLVLARREGFSEHVVIGENLARVYVTEVRRTREGYVVRLGIDADKSISVHRSEVWARIQAEAEGR